jgi:glycosyltransferase involved in cell wall biosynthesis
MRILHYLSVVRAEVGGPARAVTDLCAAFARRGHQVTLCTADDTDVPKEWKGGSAAAGVPRLVTVAPPTIPGGFFSKSALAPIERLIAEHDVLHLHGAWGPWNVQLGRAARRIGVPYFVSIRGMLDDWCMAQKGLKKTLFLKLGGTAHYENAASVHLTAQFEYEQAKKYFPRGRGTVIPNLLDLQPFRTLPPESIARAKFPHLGADNPNNEPVLLFLSRIHVKKGVEHLLRAVRLLNDTGTPCRAIIAGSGDEQYVASLKSLCTELNLNTKVAFVGLVTGDDKLSLYRAADLFVLPTSQENFGFVFVEALACGTPVITTKGVDIWPELESSGAALIAPGNPEGTADAVKAMLAKGKDRLNADGEKGRAWTFDWLDPDKVMDQFERMYEAPRAGTKR